MRSTAAPAFANGPDIPSISAIRTGSPPANADDTSIHPALNASAHRFHPCIGHLPFNQPGKRGS
ncbi:hypothetical protein [Burkholderia cepacia]|uniref:hypothetical protein n=1 Tax=Burkholderia cepacia TaxID=292 RepID=UPI002148D9E1|nr:hypothetical protein [Burkholderia cepacia]